MYREELYKRTVDIILDAYNEKKLVHEDPCGCFIGNIVQSCHPVEYYHNGEDSGYKAHWFQVLNPKWNPIQYDLAKGLEQIKSTGYTMEEVIQLENAFEGAFKKDLEEEEKTENPSQYWGMKAALEKLAEIHNTEPKESIEKLDKIQQLVYEIK